MFRDELIGRIAQPAWDEDGHIKQWPWEGQLEGDLQRGGAACIGDAVLDEDKGVQPAGIDAILRQQGLAKVGLQWCKVESCLVVVFEDELHCTSTKMTYAIEQYEMGW